MGIGYYRWLNGVDFELVVQQIYICNINGEKKMRRRVMIWKKKYHDLLVNGGQSCSRCPSTIL